MSVSCKKLKRRKSPYHTFDKLSLIFKYLYKLTWLVYSSGLKTCTDHGQGPTHCERTEWNVCVCVLLTSHWQFDGAEL